MIIRCVGCITRRHFIGILVKPPLTEIRVVNIFKQTGAKILSRDIRIQADA